jgi:transcription initiation factor TFIIIB Brf1 subunit/transcription initiation factor TFIIB
MTVDYDFIWGEFNSQAEQFNKKKNMEKKCCENFYNIEKGGYSVCTNCGVVNSNLVVDSDIFTFENGDNNKFLRQYDNYLFPKSSTSTKISGNSKLAKMQAWQSMPYNERVLWEVSNQLKSLKGQFSDRIINDALSLYKNFYEASGIFRGENKKGFVAVCLYIATSQNFSNMTPKEVANILKVDLKVLYKCIQKYSEIMGVSTNCNKSSASYVEGFITRMGLEYRIRKPLLKIIEYVEKTQILGSCIPQNICLGSIVFICKEMKVNLDQTLVSKEFSISITSLEKIISKLEKNKQKMFTSIKNSK